MPQWIDLKSHDVALLVRKNAAERNELVLRRLRPEAVIPDAALSYGFQPEGGIYVRTETRFNLPEIRRFFPNAEVADMAMEDIVYRVARDVTPLPEANPSTSPRATAPAVEHQDEAAEAPHEWARIPRPRFRIEADTQSVDGRLQVQHGEHAAQTARRSNPEVAKDEVHRAAVDAAIKRGERLPFAVLVDYPELAYFGARKSHASVRVGKLLSQLGIAEQLMAGEDGYAKLINPPYMDLAVERLPYPDGDRLILTHYRSVAGDLVLDAELVFSIRDGRLFLKETAVENVLRGGEYRGYDAYFANVFSRNLLEQGFGSAKVTWPNELAPALERGAAEGEIATGVTAVTVETGEHAGMTLAVDLGSERPLVALGASPAAASASLADQSTMPEAGPRRLIGSNVWGHALSEDEHGRRHLAIEDLELVEPVGHRGLEYLTVSEGQRSGQLSLVRSTPIEGAQVFGKSLFRVLQDADRSPVLYAMEERPKGEFHGYRLELVTAAGPTWQSLGRPWTQGLPSDSELRLAKAQPSDAFDPAALIAQLNELLQEANEPQPDAMRIPLLDASALAITHPDPATYEVRRAEPNLPLPTVRIVADGDLWRATQQHSLSMRGPLETAFAWANQALANERMNYLRHLHRAVDGNLHIGLPAQEFDALRHALHKVAIREHTAWEQLGLAKAPATPMECFVARSVNDSRLSVQLRDSQLTYEVFALERDPVSTLRAYEKDGVQRLSAWLQQVDEDLAWEQTLTTHRAGSQLQEWLTRYQDLQIHHFGERFAARVPSEWARGTVLALADRNLDRLLSMLSRNAANVPSTSKLFQEISGLSLGTNQQSREAAIYAFCGYSPTDAETHRVQRDRRAQIQQQEREVRRTIEACEKMHVSHNGANLTGRAFVDNAFNEGFTRLHTYQRGAATRYGLLNPQTSAYYQIKEPLTSYARHLIAIRDTAMPTPVPDPEDRPAPAL